MGVELPDSLQFPWAWGEYELRYQRLPAILKNRHPLWVSARALREAKVVNHKLYTGEAVFNSLVVDAEWMDASTLESLLHLLEQGFNVHLLRIPGEAGRRKDPRWEDLLSRVLGHHALARTLELLPSSPILDADQIPDYWCREDGDEIYVFIAHPASRNLRYPLRYGQADEAKHERMEVLFRWRGMQRLATLDFQKGRSLLLMLRPDGRIDELPLPFVEGVMP